MSNFVEERGSSSSEASEDGFESCTEEEYEKESVDGSEDDEEDSEDEKDSEYDESVNDDKDENESNSDSESESESGSESESDGASEKSDSEDTGEDETEAAGSENSHKSSSTEQTSVVMTSLNDELPDTDSVLSMDKERVGQRKKADVLTEEEKRRACAVFTHCSTHPKKDLIDEDQFNLALSLLGTVEKSEYVHSCFLKERVDHIDCEIFLELLAELRVKGDAGDLAARIQAAFDAIYAGTCELDDQRDESGRKYIFADDLRSLLTSTGQALSEEEASCLIRECRPVKMVSGDGVMQDVIYFVQYKGMLLDNST